MAHKDKIDSLIGFAVKAGKVLYGIDTIEKAKRRYYAIFVCRTAAEGTRKRVLACARRNNVQAVLSEQALESVVCRKNCKVVAITDRQMAEAMLTRLGENYGVISSEVK